MKYMFSFRRYMAVDAATILFAVISLLTFNKMMVEEELYRSLYQTESWAAVQTEIEYLRFLNALDQFGLYESTITHDVLIERFDHFWGRLPAILVGEESEGLVDFNEVPEEAAEILRGVAALAPSILMLEKGDRDAAQEVRTRLESLDLPARLPQLRAFSQDSGALPQGSLHETHLELVAYFVGLLLSGGVFIFLLFRQIRKAKGLFEGATAAEARATAARTQLTEAIESISEAFVLFDPDDRLVLYNSNCDKFWPTLSAKAGLGIRYADLVRMHAESGDVLIPDGNVDDWVRIQLEFHRQPLGTREQHLTDGRVLAIGESRTRDGGTVLVCDDITHRKRADEALRESEERFRNIFESGSVGAALLDLDGNLLEANEALCDFLGFSEGELLTKNFKDFTHADDLHQNVRNLQDMLAGRIPGYQMEKRYLRKSGEVAWGLLGVRLLRDADGNPHRIIAQVQDIIEQKQAGEALRKSEAHLSHAEQMAGLGHWFADEREVRIIRCSAGAARIFGRRREALQVTYEEFLEFVHPEDRARQAREMLYASFPNGYGDEYRIVRPDSEVRYIYELAEPSLTAPASSSATAALSRTSRNASSRSPPLKRAKSACGRLLTICRVPYSVVCATRTGVSAIPMSAPGSRRILASTRTMSWPIPNICYGSSTQVIGMPGSRPSLNPRRT